jgi:protoporphyrin/coproporphyrin ferrochelatase
VRVGEWGYIRPMKTAVLLLGFGEPDSGTLEAVTPFLERIFVANAALDPAIDVATIRRRARAMAESRAPALVDDYRRIGGSPLNTQAVRQAGLLELELRARGHDALVRAGMQFTDPSIAAALEEAAGERPDRVVAVPTYPLCGPSTTILALRELRRAVDELGLEIPVHEITGWHSDPAYTALRADGVLAFCERKGVNLTDPGTRLVFAAHGTPVHYLQHGSRYDLYVEDHCRRLAGALGVDRFVLGFQNHSNRPGVAWTRPEIERAIEGLDAQRIVVVPVSFMQEHSETLAELDLGLGHAAREIGLEFHRVPVPHDDPRFIALLGRLVASLLDGVSPGPAGWGPCRCRPTAGAVCLNAELERAGS